jgi:multiple sugar transport system permease protein
MSQVRPRLAALGWGTALVVVSVAFLYPFVWLVSASLKKRQFVFDNSLIPSPFAWENYVDVWDKAPMLLWLGNSVVVGLAAATAVTLSSAMVAFGFAHFRFPGRNLMFGLVLGTMMLPGAVTMVPVYLEWNAVGLASTQVPLWAQNLFGSAFFVFLLRQFFLSLPRDVFEAARVDGASYLRMFWSIVLPLARPGLIVVFIFELKNSWVDLIRPLIYLRDPELYTLPRGLKAVLDRFGQTGGEAEWQIVMAASTVATVPMILVFFLAQRYFVRGLVTQQQQR